MDEDREHEQAIEATARGIVQRSGGSWADLDDNAREAVLSEARDAVADYLSELRALRLREPEPTSSASHDVEITPEMVAAGVAELEAWFPDEASMADDDAQLVRRVYCAMRRADGTR